MKKLFLFLIVAILTTSCNINELILLEVRDEMNKQCPLVSEGMTLENVIYEIGDEYFIYNISVDETKCSMSAIKENSEALAQNIKANHESPLNQEFVNACIDAEVLLLYQYYGSLSGEVFSVTYYPATQEYTTTATSCNVSESMLLAVRDEMNKQCPLVSAEGMTVENVIYEIGDEYFICNYSIDETKCPMWALKAGGEELVQVVKESVETSEYQVFIDALIDAEVAVVFQYLGSTSGEGISVTYYPATQEYTVNNSLGN